MTNVEPVMGQPLCFRVRSRTNPETQYFVNWVEHFCTCPSFHKTSAKHLADSGTPLVCWHMNEAMKCGWDNYVSTVKEIQLAQ